MGRGVSEANLPARRRPKASHEQLDMASPQGQPVLRNRKKKIRAAIRRFQEYGHAHYRGETIISREQLVRLFGRNDVEEVIRKKEEEFNTY